MVDFGTDDISDDDRLIIVEPDGTIVELASGVGRRVWR